MSNGVLSQEEIDALLNTSNISADEPSAESVAEPLDEAVAAVASELANTEEALAPTVSQTADNQPLDLSVVLSAMEQDAIGEVGNISMGSAATALSTLLDSRVEITTPQIELTTYGRLRSKYPLPFLVVDVSYTRGLEGSNLLVIRHQDAAIIADLMMGNDGSNPPEELTEFQLGAVGEAMNQMMGSSCTAMSSVLGQRIEIGIPVVRTVNFANETLAQGVDENEQIILVNFQMRVGELINSEIMQILPVKFARLLLADLMDSEGDEVQNSSVSSPQAAEELPQPMVAGSVQNQTNNMPPQGGYSPQQDTYPPQQGMYQPQQGMYPPQQGMYQPQQGMYPPQQAMYPPQQGMYPPQQGMYPPQQGMYQNGAFPGQSPYNGAGSQPSGSVKVQPAQFTALNTGNQLNEHGNIALIMDVPLQVTVELGKTRKTIKEILELGPGSVLELDKLAGEPVDLLVNGKLVAKGEVVVIDENFGVRVTDIVSPMERVANLQ